MHFRVKMLCSDDGGRDHEHRTAKNTAPGDREGQRQASGGSMSCPHLELLRGSAILDQDCGARGAESLWPGQRQTQQVHSVAQAHTGPWSYDQTVL